MAGYLDYGELIQELSKLLRTDLTQAELSMFIPLCNAQVNPECLHEVLLMLRAHNEGQPLLTCASNGLEYITDRSDSIGNTMLLLCRTFCKDLDESHVNAVCQTYLQIISGSPPFALAPEDVKKKIEKLVRQFGNRASLDFWELDRKFRHFKDFRSSRRHFAYYFLYLFGRETENRMPAPPPMTLDVIPAPSANTTAGTSAMDSIEKMRAGGGDSHGLRLSTLLHDISPSLPALDSDGPYTSVSGASQLQQAPAARLIASSTDSDTSDVLVPQIVKSSNEQYRQELNPEITESQLIKDVIFAMQGIEGNTIKYSASTETYIVDPQANVPVCRRQLANRCAEFGFLYRKVEKFLAAHENWGAHVLGVVKKGLLAAVKRHRNEFYRLLAVLEGQIDSSQASENDETLTLIKMSVLLTKPTDNFSVLAGVVEEVRQMKGEPLVSALHEFTKHADHDHRLVCLDLLYGAMYPMFLFILQWIESGDLNDQCKEFFIRSVSSVQKGKFWESKFIFRKDRIPSVISRSFAKMIFDIGRSINLLTLVCDRDLPPWVATMVHPAWKVLNKGNGGDLYDITNENQNSYLFALCTKLHSRISRHLIDVLFQEFNYNDHFLALRDYLLLGRGDFVLHLMDLLDVPLQQPATKIQNHILRDLLNRALCSSSAYYNKKDVVMRIDFNRLEAGAGDTGWDVFTLSYATSDHPFGAMLGLDVLTKYHRMFNMLWRTRRLEYVLVSAFQTQLVYGQSLACTLPELAPVLHQCHMLRHTMLAFIHQFQYFEIFEVILCSWVTLQEDIDQANSLEDMRLAHVRFINAVVTKSFLSSSQEILSKQRAVLNVITKFVGDLHSVYDQAMAEQERRLHYEKYHKKKKPTQDEVQIETAHQADFIRSCVMPWCDKLKVLTQTYEDIVGEFLLLLHSSGDKVHDALAYRLDFNDTYKRSKPEIRISLTFRGGTGK